MTDLKEKLYQMFILGVGKQTKQALTTGLGGVIFFTKDIRDAQQFKNLITELKSRVIFYRFVFNNMKDDAFEVAYRSMVSK